MDGTPAVADRDQALPPRPARAWRDPDARRAPQQRTSPIAAAAVSRAPRVGCERLEAARQLADPPLQRCVGRPNPPASWPASTSGSPSRADASSRRLGPPSARRYIPKRMRRAGARGAVRGPSTASSAGRQRIRGMGLAAANPSRSAPTGAGHYASAARTRVEHCASSTSHDSGSPRRLGQSLSTALATKKWVRGAPPCNPKATRSSSCWGRAAARSRRAVRAQWCNPANGSSISDSTSAPRIATRCALCVYPQAFWPIPASPRRNHHPAERTKPAPTPSSRLASPPIIPRKHRDSPLHGRS